MSIASFFGRIRSDERGVSLVEMALVAPFLGVLLMGCIDFGRGLSERLELQQAAHRTIELANSRALLAGEDADDVDYSFLVEEAATAAEVEPDQVFLTRWLECNGEVQDADVTVCPADELVARYIQLEIHALYDPVFKLARLYPTANADGKVPMIVEAAVRIQ